MSGKPRMRAVLAFAGGLAASMALPQPVRADDSISTDDLQAVARSLGFLESIPHDGTIVVGVVYAPSSPDGKARAADAAQRLAGIPGPKSAVFHTSVLDAGDLGHTTDRLDAIFLMPGVAEAPGGIVDTIRQRRLVSISADPACLDQRCCVLMVHAGQRLEIVLDTNLADAVGAHFSTVFMMMVKRK